MSMSSAEVLRQRMEPPSWCCVRGHGFSRYDRFLRNSSPWYFQAPLVPSASDRIKTKRMVFTEDPDAADAYSGLEWTYKMEDGTCTQSHALVTAARFGLPAEILSRAEALSLCLDADGATAMQLHRVRATDAMPLKQEWGAPAPLLHRTNHRLHLMTSSKPSKMSLAQRRQSSPSMDAPAFTGRHMLCLYSRGWY